MLWLWNSGSVNAAVLNCSENKVKLFLYPDYFRLLSLEKTIQKLQNSHHRLYWYFVRGHANYHMKSPLGCHIQVNDLKSFSPLLGRPALALGDRDDGVLSLPHTSALSDPSPVVEHSSGDPLPDSPYKHLSLEYRLKSSHLSSAVSLADSDLSPSALSFPVYLSSPHFPPLPLHTDTSYEYTRVHISTQTSPALFSTLLPPNTGPGILWSRTWDWLLPICKNFLWTQIMDIWIFFFDLG